MKNIWTWLWTPLRDCLLNNIKERVCYLEFSYVLFIKKCSSSDPNNSNHCYNGGAWYICELKKNCDTELKFFAIKPIHQEQSTGSVL